MKHVLKIEAPYFEAVLSGDKRFEVRFNDRGYCKDDLVELHEIRGAEKVKTGRVIYGIITYVTAYGQREGWVVYGLRVTGWNGESNVG